MRVNSKNNSVKVCSTCKVILTESNWNNSLKKNYDYTCRRCWQKQNVIESRKYKTHTCHDGKDIILTGVKRPYPKEGLCELCNKESKILHYHHWDDNNLKKGLWLDGKCHIFADGVERTLSNLFTTIRYLLKRFKV